MRQATEAVKGSDWESVLYPEPISLDDRRFLKDFRKRDVEVSGPFPDDDGGAA